MAREWSRRSIEEIARKIGKGLGGNTKFYTMAEQTVGITYYAVGFIDTANSAYNKYVLPLKYPHPGAYSSGWSIPDDVMDIAEQHGGCMFYSFNNSVFLNNSQNLRRLTAALTGSGLSRIRDIAKNTTDYDYSIELYNKNIFNNNAKPSDVLDGIYNKSYESSLIQRWDINDKLFVTNPDTDNFYIEIRILQETPTFFGSRNGTPIENTNFLTGLDALNGNFTYYYPIHYDSNDDVDSYPEFLLRSDTAGILMDGDMVYGELYTAWKNNFYPSGGGQQQCVMYLVSRKK